MKRYFIKYKGIVQGVGFRFRIQQLASKYDIAGYIANLDDGSVEVEAQGQNANLDEFLKESLHLGGFVQIEDYAVKEISVDEYDKTFIVYY